MELYIDTSKNDLIRIAIENDGVVLFENSLEAKYSQAEKLLPAIQDLLKSAKIDLKSIEKIKVKETGEGFSSLRIGVVTSNALAYGLGIPIEGEEKENKLVAGDFEIILPKYNKEPNIG